MNVCTPIFTSLGYIPNKRIVGSYVKPMLNFFAELPNFFPKVFSFLKDSFAAFMFDFFVV